MIAAIPRIISMLGFRPALFTQDSFVYLRYGLHPGPNWMRPTGYCLLLLLARPLHSFDAVTGAQHLAGLAVAGGVYLLLRSRGLPAWGATLAAAPTLVDPRQIWLEQSILPDLWFEVLAVAAIVALLGRRRPAWWQAALAGFCAGLATITRGNGFPLAVIVLGGLVIRRVGWRRTAMAALACAVPVLGYMTAFYLGYGQFTLTEGDGLFLWARTMSFANCAIIKPPPSLTRLCKQNQPDVPPSHAPAWSWHFLVVQRQPAAYLWDKRSWLWAGPHKGMNAAGNELALRFAIRAITAQPLGYARVVARDVLLTFVDTDRALQFSVRPHVAELPRAWTAVLLRYGGTSADSHGVQPWAFLMLGYQQPVYFSGVAFAIVLGWGLARITRRWRDGRRGRPALVVWAAAAAIIVAPVALSEYDYRYALPAVPLACLAAALTFAPPRLPGQRASRSCAASAEPPVIADGAVFGRGNRVLPFRVSRSAPVAPGTSDHTGWPRDGGAAGRRRDRCLSGSCRGSLPRSWPPVSSAWRGLPGCPGPPG